EDVLPHLLAIVRLLRTDRVLTVPRRLGIGVRVESRLLDGAAPWPETATAALARVGLPGHPVREIRDPARVLGRAPYREPRHRQVEAPPEEVHRAALAHEAGTELLQHAVGLTEYLPAPVRQFGLIHPVLEIL